MEKTKEEIVQELIEVFNSAKLKKKEVLDVMIDFMYHLGQTLEEKQYISSQEILMDYAEHPRLGNALMAQALWIKDTWKERKIK